MKNLLLLSAIFLLALGACNDDDEIDSSDDILEDADTNLETEPVFIDLLGEQTFPEGILTRENGDIFIGGFGDGSIQLINNGTDVSYFNNPGENGMEIAVGLVIDESRDRLWVANFTFSSAEGDAAGSQMKAFNLNTGALEATVPEDFIPGVFFNEIVLDADGDVFISDTFNPQIWRAESDLSGVEVFVNDDLLLNPDPERGFGLNGLAITPNGNFLLASVMDRLDAGDGRLVRIGLSDQSVTNVTLTGSTAVSAFAGSDGMFFYNNSLFMVNVFSSAGAIITADFNSDFSEASLIIRDQFQSIYNRPTASDVRDGRLWTVNSQLDHIINDNNGAVDTPQDVPFQVVHVSLSELLQ